MTAQMKTIHHVFSISQNSTLMCVEVCAFQLSGDRKQVRLYARRECDVELTSFVVLEPQSWGECLRAASKLAELFGLDEFRVSTSSIHQTAATKEWSTWL